MDGTPRGYSPRWANENAGSDPPPSQQDSYFTREKSKMLVNCHAEEIYIILQSNYFEKKVPILYSSNTGKNIVSDMTRYSRKKKVTECSQNDKYA